MTSVYIIESAATGHFKVGVSVAPLKRLSAIQRHNPQRLTLAAALMVPGATPRRHALAVERRFHERYLAYHERAEWFRASDLIRADVAAINDGTFDLSSLPVDLTEASLLRKVARGRRSRVAVQFTEAVAA